MMIGAYLLSCFSLLPVPEVHVLSTVWQELGDGRKTLPQEPVMLLLVYADFSKKKRV